MKLEVGMYIRTNKGNIGKLKKHYLGSITEPNEYVFENGYGFSEAEYEYITKSSFNIIDLIEVGDYVNGEIVQKDNFDNLITITSFASNGMFNTIESYGSKLKNEDIDYVLTHEQYEANCYKVNNEKK